MKKVCIITIIFFLVGESFSQTTNLMFSEYVEGNSNEKYLEIYNGTGASVNLTSYSVELYANGNAGPPTSTLTLSGTLNNGQVLVLKHGSAVLYTGTATVATGVCSFNGDDALVLKNSGTIIDVIGQVGCDPGSRWQIGSFQTLDKTLIRKPDICSGYDGTSGGACGTGSFPTLNTEWIQKNTDDVSNLGTHLNNCGNANITHTFFRSKQNGDWYDINTWESSTTYGGAYSPAVKYPTFNNTDSIEISAAHTVTITGEAVVADQVKVTGRLNLGQQADLDFNNGSGIELNVTGIFADSSQTTGGHGVLDLSGTNAETWQLGAGASFYKLRNSSSTFYRDSYNGGISTIPATANWYLRCIDATALPAFLSANMYYPNLYVENFSGTVWDMTSALLTFSSGTGPTVKGNLDIGGTGTTNVIMVQNAANAAAGSTPIIVQGNCVIRSTGKFVNEKISTPNLYGGGLSVSGNITVESGGTLEIKNNQSDPVKSALTLNGNSTQTISGAGTVSLTALEMNKTGTSVLVTTSLPVLVTDSLYLTKGILQTATGAELTLHDTAIISSPGSNYNTCCAVTNIGWEKGFITGPLKKQLQTTAVQWIPIGKINGTDTSFAPIRLEKFNTNLTTYTAEYFSTGHFDAPNVENPPVDHVSYQEYWEITSNTVSPDCEAKLTLAWRPYSKIGNGVPGDSISSMNDLLVAHYFNSGLGTKWRYDGAPTATFTIGTGSNFSYGYISQNNTYTGSFSPFTFGSKSMFNLLPVKIILFDAWIKNQFIEVACHTKDEVNIAYYTVEKSADAVHFEPIRVFTALQNTTNSYAAIDTKPAPGWNYYRLKITDNSGKITYSTVIKKWFGISQTIQVYPNPSTDVIYLTLPVEYWEIINSLGETLIKPSSATSVNKINVTALPPGMYGLRYRVAGKPESVAGFIKN